MSVAQRKTPTQANGGSDDGVEYTNAVDVEVEYLHEVAFGFLINVGGTANAITAESDTARVAVITAYKAGMGFWLEPGAANTSAVQINIDGVGNVNLKDQFGSALQGGELSSNGLYPIVYDGTQFRALTVTAGSASSVASAPDVILWDQRNSGVAGDALTSGAWRARTMNTVSRNALSAAGVSLNPLTGQVTLPAGTWYIKWTAATYETSISQSRLFNVTDNSVPTDEQGNSAYGSTVRCTSLAAPWSSGQIVLTLTSPKAFRIESRVTATNNANGGGIPSGFGTVERYSSIEIWKQ